MTKPKTTWQLLPSLPRSQFQSTSAATKPHPSPRRGRLPVCSLPQTGSGLAPVGSSPFLNRTPWYDDLTLLLNPCLNSCVLVSLPSLLVSVPSRSVFYETRPRGVSMLWATNTPGHSRVGAPKKARVPHKKHEGLHSRDLWEVHTQVNRKDRQNVGDN